MKKYRRESIDREERGVKYFFETTLSTAWPYYMYHTI